MTGIFRPGPLCLGPSSPTLLLSVWSPGQQHRHPSELEILHPTRFTEAEKPGVGPGQLSAFNKPSRCFGACLRTPARTCDLQGCLSTAEGTGQRDDGRV